MSIPLQKCQPQCMCSRAASKWYSSLPTLGQASEETHFEHRKIQSVLLLQIGQCDMYITTLGAVASSAVILFHALELKAVVVHCMIPSQDVKMCADNNLQK